MSGRLTPEAKRFVQAELVSDCSTDHRRAECLRVLLEDKKVEQEAARAAEAHAAALDRHSRILGSMQRRLNRDLSLLQETCLRVHDLRQCGDGASVQAEVERIRSAARAVIEQVDLHLPAGGRAMSPEEEQAAAREFMSVAAYIHDLLRDVRLLAAELARSGTPQARAFAAELLRRSHRIEAATAIAVRVCRRLVGGGSRGDPPQSETPAVTVRTIAQPIWCNAPPRPYTPALRLAA